MKRIADLTQVVVLGREESSPDDEFIQRPHLPVPADVLVYHIEGPLFFGSVEKAFNRSLSLRQEIRTLLLDLTQVPVIDISGVVAMESLIINESRRGLKIILCGNHTITRRILQKLPVDLQKSVICVSQLHEAITLASIHE